MYFPKEVVFPEKNSISINDFTFNDLIDENYFLVAKSETGYPLISVSKLPSVDKTSYLQIHRFSRSCFL